MDNTPDRFEEAYHESGLGAAPPPPSAPSHGGFALRGSVLTPERELRRGFVSVNPDGLIGTVGHRRPESVPVLDTDGVILPGMIDLHGHPDFNVFAPWEPPNTFTNRYQWRASDIYRRLIRDTQNRLLGALPLGTQEHYAEIRALVGGVTAIQGASAREVTDGHSVVRHVDLPIFGAARARTLIDLPFPGTPAAEYLKAIVAQIAAGAVDAFYLHLAEGRPDDAVSASEFDRLVSSGALTSATIVIHGTGLQRTQLGQMAEAGAKLVWSPQSNLRLYAVTTAAADALAVGLPLAVGADWLPSGSLSLLAELKVARRVLAQQGHPVSSQALVEMVTSGAAAIAGLADKLGSIEQGRPADLVVLERRREDPWLNVVEAEPSWIELVCVNGSPAYGRADWLVTIDPARLEPATATEPAPEPVLAWGRPMLLSAPLTDLRAALIAEYPQTGPIFA
ncbi:MAG: amidohydrolase family protein [Actinomycetota bacterium]|nr:amidohydrolase family protein [Actinomycetota bacterium]